MAVDQTLRCRECGVDFIWTEGEQQFFSSKGLTNPPSRCPSCRAARKAAGMGGGGYGGGRGLKLLPFAKPAPSRQIGAVWRSSSARVVAIEALCAVLAKTAVQD